MEKQSTKATRFAELHVKNHPVVLFNIWDAGTARVVSESGAKAVALGSHAVAESFGYEDGENIPLELVLENARRVVNATDLPVTLDFEAGYGETPDEVKASVLRALQTGIVGINLEDKIPGGAGLFSVEDQVERIKAARAAAKEYGVMLFINARTDLFKEAAPETHDNELVDQAIERARAFASAGADGFFAPLIIKGEHMARICEESPLPVNIIWLPGMSMPDPKEIATLGASRISYGPGPWLEMKEWLKAKAENALL